MDQPDDPVPTHPSSLRRPWTEGPDEDAPEESWLSAGDDELLHRIETVGPDDTVDERLLEVVQSDRHFFIRQEAAKKVRNRTLLFPFEDDRHIGQILVRYLTRREDVTYLERLVARSRHTEVRAAAQVQLAQLWGRLGGPTANVPAGEEPPPPPVFSKPEPAESVPPIPPAPETVPDEAIEIEMEAEELDAVSAPPASVEPVAGGDGGSALEAAPPTEPAAVAEPAGRTTEERAEPPAATTGRLEALAAEAAAAVEAMEKEGKREGGGTPGDVAPEKETAPPPTDEGVDGSLLGWAIHFLVERVWNHLDTRAARGLLLRTHAELLPFRPALTFFSVEDDAHVHVDLTRGARLPREAVAAVAAWMAAFLEATRASVPDLGEVDIRESTRLMSDALEQVGFYEAVRELEEKA